MVNVSCMIVGRVGSVFTVQLDAKKRVANLGELVVKKNLIEYEGADRFIMKAYLAKSADGGNWLKSNDPDVIAMGSGIIPGQVRKLLKDKVDLLATIGNVLRHAPEEDVVHVLLRFPRGEDIKIKEIKDNPGLTKELRFYQNVGRMIESNCEDYCASILDKIDTIYEDTANPKQFICVQGSSGMGKTQLAFALRGNGRKHARPWFYWSTSIHDDPQLIYQNFFSMAIAFDKVTYWDMLSKEPERDILQCSSSFYQSKKLWTYGFIRELLYYSAMNQRPETSCSSSFYQSKKLWTYGFIRELLYYSAMNQRSELLRLENVLFNVEQCSLSDVWAVMKLMTDEKKTLPFFILDGVAQDTDQHRGKKLPAFQRNIFRCCGLVVIVMGTDAKVTDLVNQSKSSRRTSHKWMTVISRFPPYQYIPCVDDAMQSAWERVIGEHSVVQYIAQHSRGMFARWFVNEVARLAMNETTFDLCELLDEAFYEVSYLTQTEKGFMDDQNGRYTQLMAISYSNADLDQPAIRLSDTPATTSESQRKRKRNSNDDTCQPSPNSRNTTVGTNCMNLHFANVVDDQTTCIDVMSSGGKLITEDRNLWGPLCRFPTIEKDLLLYLAILGGKDFSGYYDHLLKIAHSTFSIFSQYLSGKGFQTDENTNAPSNNFKILENMVSHMIFCASRRHGVRGIAFDDFFAGLLGECQKTTFRPMTMSLEGKIIVATDLFSGYTNLASFVEEVKIPFLAPPNAKWPDNILDLGHGCNFGHLVQNNERLENYVTVRDGSVLFVSDCKYRKDNVDSGLMNSIIDGWNAAEDQHRMPSNWKIGLVFCEKLASFKNEWVYPTIGCVAVNCCVAANSQKCEARWIFQPPQIEERQKLVVVIETGSV
ncbi:Crinkler (CRN) [Phytophthora megakarya]|uniref:Crinkler (CRN) n=1 Tax=Phytophthora megakarya TaxID=4795 RepID=A0A225WCV2_9STRA|nr:Crinkler (CRN) [Phytophthora megakarya]